MPFERYSEEEGGKVISREELSSRTQANLAYLEESFGFKFDNEARKAQFGYSPLLYNKWVWA